MPTLIFGYPMLWWFQKCTGLLISKNFERKYTVNLTTLCDCGISNAAHASESKSTVQHSPIADRLFNGLTANNRWHRIYQSQQCSLSLGKGLMLAETVAETDGHMLPIFIHWSLPGIKRQLANMGSSQRWPINLHMCVFIGFHAYFMD